MCLYFYNEMNLCDVRFFKFYSDSRPNFMPRCICNLLNFQCFCSGLDFENLYVTAILCSVLCFRFCHFVNGAQFVARNFVRADMKSLSQSAFCVCFLSARVL